MKPVLVSVIIPIYNVENYLEECFASVAKQTYPHIEVIAINDGSTDSSGKICEKWEKQKGFRYISKSNEGLGPTRNLGVSIAQGDYITFLDSDDYLSEDAVQNLVACLEKNNYPEVVVTARHYERDELTGKITEVPPREKWNVDCIEKENEVIRRKFLLYGYCMAWGKLYKKSFMLDKEIKMPAIAHEDNAVFPTVVFGAERIAICDIPVYYYRVNRHGSIIAGGRSRQYISDACECFMKYFAEHKLLEKYYAILKCYVEIQLRVSYEKFCNSESDINTQQKILEKFEQFYNKYFSNAQKQWEYCFDVMGGFGLRGIVQGLGWDAKQMKCHYPFSSIIAQMTEGKAMEYSVFSENSFRKEKIDEDITGKVEKKLESKEKCGDFLFLDFVEERYDIAKLTNGNLITLSEAFFDSKIQGITIERIIKSGSNEFMEIWRKKCENLVFLLKQKYELKRIILVESKLALRYVEDDIVKEFAQKEELQETNQMLGEMYDYFYGLFDGKIQRYTYEGELLAPVTCRYGSGPQYLCDNNIRSMREKIKVTFDI